MGSVYSTRKRKQDLLQDDDQGESETRGSRKRRLVVKPEASDGGGDVTDIKRTENEDQADQDRTSTTTTTSGNSTHTLCSLPSDALVSVLCRVPSTDHHSLWKTCKILRETIDSEEYCSERAATGWAEVTTRIVPKEELWERGNVRGYHDPVHDPDSEEYDEEESKRQRERDLDTYFSHLGTFDRTYQWHNIETEVKIDGMVAGRIDLALIPRSRRGNEFHEAAKRHSTEIADVCCSLCDHRGRPRVRSINDADPDGSAKYGGFLHVVKVRICSRYRPSDNADVVAAAVHRAFREPKLKGEWTLATAWTDPGVYYTSKDEEFVEEAEERWRADGSFRHADESYFTLSDSLNKYEEGRKFKLRWKKIAEHDARMFLRVGFKQLPELVLPEELQPFWLFALPSFLDNNEIMTQEEVKTISLRKPPNLPPKPEGANRELLDLLIMSCSRRGRLSDTIPSLQRQLSPWIQRLEQSERDLAENNASAENLEQQIADINRMIEQNSEQLDNNAQAQAQIRDIRARIGEFRVMIDESREFARIQQPQIEQARQMVNELHTKIDIVRGQVQASLDVMDRIVIDESTKIVREKGASIRSSFALHCVCRHLIFGYVDAFLQLIPADERASALNDLDSEGCTPLMMSVMALPYRNEADDQQRFVEALIARGADKNIVDPVTERTALGRYRNAIRADDDQARAHGVASARAEREAWRPIHRRMEQSLMPTLGETDADRDAKTLMREAESSDEEQDDDDGHGEE